MSRYPIPNINDTKDLGTIANFANNATGGILFPLIILAVWSVIFMSSIIGGIRASIAWMMASFVTFVLTTMLGVAGLIAKEFILFAILLLAVGGIWLKLEGSPLN